MAERLHRVGSKQMPQLYSKHGIQVKLVVMPWLLGERNPTGRLPVTIYDENFVSDRGIAGNITNMSLRGNGGITYLHFEGEPLWPFGYGLSYTKWIVSEIGSPPTSVTTATIANEFSNYYNNTNHVGSIALPITVSTIGTRADDVVIHVFASEDLSWNQKEFKNTSSRSLPSSLSPPIRQLVGFERAHSIQPGRSQTITVPLFTPTLCKVDIQGNQWAQAGRWVLSVTVDGVTFVNTTIQVDGDGIPVFTWPTANEHSQKER